LKLVANKLSPILFNKVYLVFCDNSKVLIQEGAATEASALGMQMNMKIAKKLSRANDSTV